VNVGKLVRFGNPIPLQPTAESNQMTDTEVEILTLEEVAAYLKAGKRTAYRLAQKGGIQAFKVDREDRR
jgi:excisionase family DNA binding protein